MPHLDVLQVLKEVVVIVQLLAPNTYERSSASGALCEDWLDQFVEVDSVILAPLIRLPLIIRI
jgi:hypothetical protein